MASDPEHYLVILKVDGESKNVLPLDKKERQVTHRLPALIVTQPLLFFLLQLARYSIYEICILCSTQFLTNPFHSFRSPFRRYFRKLGADPCRILVMQFCLSALIIFARIFGWQLL